jgi:3-isopropylmalate/(R)-2-methylmalate dehydratase small subunit
MALERIRSVRGRGVTITGDDIDTDRIIPARYLKAITFDGLGEFLFQDVRFDEAGHAREHPLNDPRNDGASVMISGANFGCGSSREHAPQSIYRAGFRAVVAESFAEIFFGNSITLGMPCVTLGRSELARLTALVEAEPSTEIEIDLVALELRAGSERFGIGVPESAREALLQGDWDPLGTLLEGAEAVDSTASALPYIQRASE